MLSRYDVGARPNEMGPGHLPFPLRFPGVSVRYVDRWEPSENAGPVPRTGRRRLVSREPDIVSDLNIDGLSMVADESEDFVIASHVPRTPQRSRRAARRHPHRVLRPGGVALILLPDRTADLRSRTSRHHARAFVGRPRGRHEGARRRTHEEFLIYTEGLERRARPATRDATFERHRQRSIHVHCWTQHEFLRPALRDH